MFTLLGRLSASPPDAVRDPNHLLLCTHVPRFVRRAGKMEQSGVVPDGSAHALLSKYPPHMVVASPAPGVKAVLKLPYDLLRDREEAVKDFEAYQLGRKSNDEDDCSVCNAHITIPFGTATEKSPARIAFWQEELAKYAGQWVRLTVEPQRYSFRATAEDGSEIQRVGTRLNLRAVDPPSG